MKNSIFAHSKEAIKMTEYKTLGGRVQPHRAI